MRHLRLVLGLMVLLVACTAEVPWFRPPVGCPADGCAVVGVGFSEPLTLQEVFERSAEVGGAVVALWRTDPICVPAVGSPPVPTVDGAEEPSRFAYVHADVIRDVQNASAPPATDGGWSTAFRRRMVIEWDAAQEPDVTFAAAALLMRSPDVVVPGATVWVRFEGYLTDTTRVLYLDGHAHAFAPLTDTGLLQTGPGRLCSGTLDPNEDPIHPPDVYRTYRFSSPFAFRRSEPFVSSGESPEHVSLDVTRSETWGHPDSRVDSYTGAPAQDLAILTGGESEWQALALDFQRLYGPDSEIRRTTRSVNVGGSRVAAATIDVDCHTPSSGSTQPPPDCAIVPWNPTLVIPHGYRTMVVSLDTEATSLPHPLTFVIQESSETFDRYWNRIAEPVLESIEFSEP